MKSKKLILGLALIIMASVTAYTQQYDSEKDFKVVRDTRRNGGVIITEYLGNKKMVNIPPKIQNLPVTGIEERAFENKQLTRVTIPNSVTRIGAGAFFTNQLTSVTIPNSVTTIEKYAFARNKLTSVTIPSSVTMIEEFAFTENQLTSVTIPNSVTTIEKYAFAINKLTSVTIPSSVTMIGDSAFEGNQLTNVTIPNSVTVIGELVFSSNQLTRVTIPNSVNQIGVGAFYINQLTSITIPDGVTTIGDSAFAKNKLTSVTIPNSVTTIGAGAFADNQPLTSVSVSSATRVGRGAFGRANVTIRQTEAELAQINEASEVAAKQKREEEETRRQAEERVRSLQQIRDMVRFDGSYFPVTDIGNWKAIRFIDSNTSIKAFIIVNSNQRGYDFASLSCSIIDSVVKLEGMPVTFTASNNKNTLQITTSIGRETKSTFVFNSHSPVAGKTYYNVFDNIPVIRSYFASERILQDGRKIFMSDENFEYSYTYSEGVITERTKFKPDGGNPVVSGLFWIMGPYLVNPGTWGSGWYIWKER